MEVAYTIFHHPTVISEDIPRLDSLRRSEVKDAVRAKLTTHPDVYGKPLRETLKGFRTLRVGDYRVIYQIHVQKKKKAVLILIIGHRRDVYSEAEKRIS